MKNIDYLLALHTVNGLGPIRLKMLLNYFQDPKLAWDASREDFTALNIPESVYENLVLLKKKLNPQAYLEDIKSSQINWLTIYDQEYPVDLKQIYDPPLVLYYQGDVKVLQTSCFAIVGSRKMTSYGKLVTEKFAAQLAAGGLTIVSGLAYGVDTVAHMAAVKETGQTIAVLGGGLKHIFPATNINLAKQIANGNGVILSEYPPDSPSLPGNFPARNRIISGLSKAVLVTEATIDSGSLITAKIALDQGKDIYAVPGPITSSLSHGPISLIKAGAKVADDPQEILAELGISDFKVDAQVIANLSEDEKQILEILTQESVHVDEISRSLQLPIAKVSATILRLEIVGVVKNVGGGMYAKV